jgi:hypothetical protein
MDDNIDFAEDRGHITSYPKEPNVSPELQFGNALMQALLICAARAPVLSNHEAHGVWMSGHDIAEHLHKMMHALAGRKVTHAADEERVGRDAQTPPHCGIAGPWRAQFDVDPVLYHRYLALGYTHRPKSTLNGS